jgi:hypothetical protein
MPLTQPERDNPLMRRYFREVGLSGKQLAKRCGVAYSQIYMARTHNVGADNAQKISRTVALILGLSERDRLELKAEIIGVPGSLYAPGLATPQRLHTYWTFTAGSPRRSWTKRNP